MGEEAEEDQAGTGYHLGRLFALSDGIFAIAITLLALGLSVPAGLSQGALTRSLRDLGPELLAVALSFVVIARMWIGHRAVFGIVAKPDRVMVVLNFAYLGPVVVLPFATDVLANYGSQPAGPIIYASVVAWCALTLAALWSYLATRPHLRVSTAPRHKLGESAVRAMGTAAIFAVSIVIALWSPTAAEYSWLVLVASDQIGLAFLRRVRRHRARRRHP